MLWEEVKSFISNYLEKEATRALSPSAEDKKGNYNKHEHYF